MRIYAAQRGRRSAGLPSINVPSRRLPSAIGAQRGRRSASVWPCGLNTNDRYLVGQMAELPDAPAIALRYIMNRRKAATPMPDSRRQGTDLQMPIS